MPVMNATGGDVVSDGSVLSGRYLVKQTLGAGSAGTVFRGVDRTSGAEVAIKTIHPPLLRDQTYIVRLRRRAAHVAATTIPNTARLVGLVEDVGVPPYLLSEFVPHETLAGVMKREGPAALGDAIYVALGVARVLDAAVSRGIGRLNLKPSNICVNAGSVTLLDAGVPPVDAFTAPTAAATTIYNAEYAAPELVDGPGDARSDMYSVGVILYEMLTGRVPFGGMTPEQVMRRHANEPAVLPPGLPAAVYAVVSRSLQKAPSHRFPTPAAFVTALDECQRALSPAAARQRLAPATPRPAPDLSSRPLWRDTPAPPLVPSSGVGNGVDANLSAPPPLTPRRPSSPAGEQIAARAAPPRPDIAPPAPISEQAPSAPAAQRVSDTPLSAPPPGASVGAPSPPEPATGPVSPSPVEQSDAAAQAPDRAPSTRPERQADMDARPVARDQGAVVEAEPARDPAATARPAEAGAAPSAAPVTSTPPVRPPDIAPDAPATAVIVPFPRRERFRAAPEQAPDTRDVVAASVPAQETAGAALALLGLHPSADVTLVEMAYRHQVERCHATVYGTPEWGPRIAALGRARDLLRDPERSAHEGMVEPSNSPTPEPRAGRSRWRAFRGQEPAVPVPPERDPYQILRLHRTADHRLVDIAYRYLLGVAARDDDAAALNALEWAYARLSVASGPVSTDERAGRGTT